MRSRVTLSRFPAAIILAFAAVLGVVALLLVVPGATDAMEQGGYAVDYRPGEAATVGLTAARFGAGPSASIALLAVDGDPTGNAPRSVGTVEQCVSANVGEATQIDIVVPGPGVPAGRGIGAYQFTILYDPAVIWIADDDSDMLLAQAAGSNVIPIAEPKPDRNGIYESWGVDFGPSGIEPAGSSEAGPGVIARITLLPQRAGVSTITLSDALVIDDASDRIGLETVQAATISVGEPCSSETVTPRTATPFLSADTTAPPSGTPSAGTLPAMGGPPPARGGRYSLLMVAGLIAALAGVALLVSGKSANSSRGRGR